MKTKLQIKLTSSLFFWQYTTFDNTLTYCFSSTLRSVLGLRELCTSFNLFLSTSNILCILTTLSNSKMLFCIHGILRNLRNSHQELVFFSFKSLYTWEKNLKSIWRFIIRWSVISNISWLLVAILKAMNVCRYPDFFHHQAFLCFCLSQFFFKV